MRTIATVGVALISIACLGFGAWQVYELERGELEHLTEWQNLAPTMDSEGRPQPHRELGRVSLGQGEDVAFELCTRDGLAPELWGGRIALAVWIPATEEVVVRQALDSDVLTRATRSPDGSCVVFASGGDLRQGGEYAIEAVWPGGDLSGGLDQVPLRLRVTAYSPLNPTGRWPTLVLLCGMFAFVVLLTKRREEPAAAPGDGISPVVGDVGRLCIGLTLLIAARFAVGYLPLSGAFGSLVEALALVAVQIALVLSLVPRRSARGEDRRTALALLLPQQGLWVLALAPILGIALWLLGQLAMSWVPATSESMIGLLVAWPSGGLAMALIGGAAPLVEELFFRGFLFGSLSRRWGGAVAFVGTVLLFSLLHLPQTWGVWGGFSAIVLTAVGYTALRWWTGSVVASALAHLAQNGAIIVLAALPP